MCWGSWFVGLWRLVCCVGAVVKSSDSVRNLIGRRTESDRAAYGIRLDGGRNPIGRRTESDRAAYAIRLDGVRNPTIVSKLFRDFPTSV